MVREVMAVDEGPGSRRTAVRLGPVGRTWDGGVCSWDSDRALLYAVGVGAGSSELPYTTENSENVPQQVLPTFPVVLTGDGESSLSALRGVPLEAVLHAEQSVALFGPLPVSGSARLTGSVTGVFDKGHAAQVTTETVVRDATSGRTLAVLTSGMFVRGHGGFGGDRGSAARWSQPDRPADQVISMPTLADQALIYRLLGDRNPLHSDPAVAARAGFDRPILHGLCTFGITGRALLSAACAGDVDRFGGMSARFTAPVTPGQTLEVHLWTTGEQTLFRTYVGDLVVLDRGVLTLRPPADQPPTSSADSNGHYLRSQM